MERIKGKRETVYFSSMGRDNVSETIKIVKERCKTGDIKVLIFAATKESVINLANVLKDSDCKVCAVTFPYEYSFLLERKMKNTLKRLYQKLLRMELGRLLRKSELNLSKE